MWKNLILNVDQLTGWGEEQERSSQHQEPPNPGDEGRPPSPTVDVTDGATQADEGRPPSLTGREEGQQEPDHPDPIGAFR